MEETDWFKKLTLDQNWQIKESETIEAKNNIATQFFYDGQDDHEIISKF